jgi:hypothetical protein
MYICCVRNVCMRPQIGQPHMVPQCLRTQSRPRPGGWVPHARVCAEELALFPRGKGGVRGMWDSAETGGPDRMILLTANTIANIVHEYITVRWRCSA